MPNVSLASDRAAGGRVAWGLARLVCAALPNVDDLRRARAARCRDKPRPDRRAGREIAKVQGKNPNLVPLGQKHRLEEAQERALVVQESLLNPDYLQVI